MLSTVLGGSEAASVARHIEKGRLRMGAALGGAGSAGGAWAYQVREFSSRNWATVGAWEFMPPSMLMIWPVQ